MQIPKLDLTETPGIYYSLAYGLGALLFIHMNRQRQSRFRYVVFALVWAVQFIFMFFTYRIPQHLFPLCVAVEVFLTYAMIRSCCDIDRVRCGYYTVRAFMFGEFAASLEWQLFYYGLTALGIPLRMWFNVTLLVVVHSVTFYIFLVLEQRYGSRERSLIITDREFRTALMIALATYALSNVSYVLKNTPFSSQFTMEIFTMHTLADLGGVAFLFGYHMILQDHHSRAEAANLQKVLDEQLLHYQISKDTIDLVNRKYHDLKHQIAYLKSGITEEEKLSMLDEMEEEIRTYEHQNRTGNQVVDTILMEKSLLCEKLSITLHVIADGTAMDFLSTVEICSLLGNALDNAIEAVRDLPDPGQRQIRLYIERRRNFLRLLEENRFDGTTRQISPDTGLPETTKEDRENHGYGLCSMENIAESHDGSMYIDEKEGWFRLQILIPFPQSSAKSIYTS